MAVVDLVGQPAAVLRFVGKFPIFPAEIAFWRETSGALTSIAHLCLELFCEILIQRIVYVTGLVVGAIV